MICKCVLCELSLYLLDSACLSLLSVAAVELLRLGNLVLEAGKRKIKKLLVMKAF